MTHHNDGAVAVARDQSRIESLSVARSGRYTSGHVHSKKRLCLQSYKSPRYLRGGRSGTLKAYASFKVRKSEKQAPARLPTERGVIVSSVLAATVLWYLIPRSTRTTRLGTVLSWGIWNFTIHVTRNEAQRTKNAKNALLP
jgi:hypothetical protein